MVFRGFGLATAATFAARLFLTDAKAVAANALAVQAGNGRSGMVAFHFNETETATATGEDVTGQVVAENPTKL